MKTVNFNSFISISTCDYYGKSSCVVFFNECNFRCKNCYNKQTWNSINLVDINDIKNMIKSTTPFISAITFSGGEPYMQFDVLEDLLEYSKSIGLFTAVETNGYFTEKMKNTRDMLDAVYVDIKAPINNKMEYYNNTELEDASENIMNTLNSHLPTELRIVDNLDIAEIKKSLESYKEYPIRILPFRKMESSYDY